MNHLYEILASLLEYPGDEWDTLLERSGEWVSIKEPSVAAQFGGFRDRVLELPTSKLQELYTQTFDLNPVCTLDIGYHLFGENYKRGELLAGLRKTEAPYELGQAHQLPDYLPVLLRLLARLEDSELRQSLIGEVLLPALSKMLTALTQSDNPYRDLIDVISTALKDAVPAGNNARSRLVRAESTPELYRISSNGRSVEGCDERTRQSLKV